MALEQSVTSKYGITCSKGYIVVNGVMYDKGLLSPTNPVADGENNNSTISVVVYADKAARDNNDQHIDQLSVRFKMDIAAGDNAILQAYAHLKTLDEYKDAKDV